MKYQRYKNNYLYEGLDYSASHSMMLWESAGFKLKEAALTADQIQQIFQNVEQGATAAGGNRTVLGKGKDAAVAVNKAWEDLKTKIQNSGPIAKVDSAYDSAVSKIEAGLGGPDNMISKIIMKYRKFAKDYPVAQGFIYAALIAAAGISGAGLGGAAVLGLLKMTDKLLQGEKFSSAAYSGAKTGAMAYGASKLGDYIKGKPGGGEIPADMQQGLASDQAFQDRLLNKFPPDQGYTVAADGKGLQVLDAAGNKVWQGDIPLKGMDPKTFADLTNSGKMVNPGISSGSISGDPMAGVSDGGKGLLNITGSQDSQAHRAMYQAIQADPSLAKNSSALADIYYDKLQDLNPNVDLDFLRTKAEFAATKLAAGVGDTATSAAVDAAGTVAKMAPRAAMKAATDTATQMISSGQITDYNAALAAADKIANAYDGKVSGQTLEMIRSYVQSQLVATGQNGGWVQSAAQTAAQSAGQNSAKLAAKAAGIESIVYTGKKLSEGQIYMIFNRVSEQQQLTEGPMDFIKGVAAKGMAKLQTVGKNLTTKVTADKLNSAWKKAGSPMDSEEVAAILKQAGVGDDVVGKVYTDLKLPAAGSEENPNAAQTATSDEEIKKLFVQLNTKDRTRMIAYLTKQLGTA